MAHGTFPFGRPNTPRPLRPAARAAKALVVGVYPSAFHVRWSSPEREASVSSLAVDVEPTVFWDGVTPAPAELLERWKAAVGFNDAWGTVALGTNGPSGDGLLKEYLAPLGLEQANVAMTDIVPWFFVKHGKGSQGAAIERFNAFASKAGIKAGALPVRPSPTALVQLACGPTRRDSLRGELVETGAPLVVTLGQEALDAVRGVADEVRGVPARLAHDHQYGASGTLLVDGRQLCLVPMIHPGLLRQADQDSRWRAAHSAWADRARRAS